MYKLGQLSFIKLNKEMGMISPPYIQAHSSVGMYDIMGVIICLREIEFKVLDISFRRACASILTMLSILDGDSKRDSHV